MKDDDAKKGILWTLPELNSTDWGRLGPGFGYGIGCGVGFGAGIVGGQLLETNYPFFAWIPSALFMLLRYIVAYLTLDFVVSVWFGQVVLDGLAAYVFEELPWSFDPPFYSTQLSSNSRSETFPHRADIPVTES